jgi:Tfp pilus assembly protein PilO
MNQQQLKLRQQTDNLIKHLPKQYHQQLDDLLTKVYLTGYNNGILSTNVG